MLLRNRSILRSPFPGSFGNHSPARPLNPIDCRLTLGYRCLEFPRPLGSEGFAGQVAVGGLRSRVIDIDYGGGRSTLNDDICNS